MSFYGRNYGLPTAMRPMVAPTTGTASILTKAVAAAHPTAVFNPPVHLTAQTANLDQIAAAFEWYGLTVRPPGGFADAATIVALENHIADLLNLVPTAATIAAAQQAVDSAQTAVANAQSNLDTWKASDPDGADYNQAVGALGIAKNALSSAQSKLSAYQAAQIGNQNTVVTLALAHSPRIALALQATGEVPLPPPPPAPVALQSAATADMAPAPESFMDQYGTLVIAGGAAAAMVVIGVVLFKGSKKQATTGRYKRRRKR